MPSPKIDRDAEAFIISSASQGLIADFSQGHRRSHDVSGRFLRDLIVGLIHDDQPTPFSLPAGLRVRGATIRGPIDLRDCTANGAGLPALMLMDCRFEPEGTEICNLLERDPMPALDISGTHIASLSLNGSRFGLLKAAGCRIDGDVDISNVGALRPDRKSLLPEACCWIDFSGCRIAGMMFARDLNLRVPNWPQTIDFDRRQPRYALFLAASVIGGTVDVSGGNVRIDGGISLYLAKIGGDLWLGGCKLISNGGGALYAQGLCARAVFAERLPPLKAKGMISFSDAQIEHGISLPGAVIISAANADDGQPGTAIRANGLRTGSDVSLRKLTCKGSIRFDRAKIGGTLSLEGARLNGEGRDALHAPGIAIAGSLLLSFGRARRDDRPRGFQANGCLWLYGASVGEHLDLRGASLQGSRPDTDLADVDVPYINALSGTDLTVGDCIFVGGSEHDHFRFKAVGPVRFQRAHIAKHVEIVCASITGPAILAGETGDGVAPKDTALDLGWTKIDGSLKLACNDIRGSLNLSYAYAAILSDKIDGYPSPLSNADFQLEFEGFEYQTLRTPALLSSSAANATSLAADAIARTRFAWLARSGGRPHSYAMLARALQRQALPDAAREVMVQQQKHEHRWTGWSEFWTHPGRTITDALMRLFGLTFGYGFSPRSATKTLITTWILGAAFFCWADYRGAMVIDQQPVAIAIGSQKPVTLEIPDKQTLFGAHAASDIPCHSNMNAALYALDVFIPLVDLREESKCDMGRSSGTKLVAGEETIYRLIKTAYALLGWLTISLSILTYTGFIERRSVATP